MPANIDPIYSRTPDVQVGGAILGPTAITAQDGTGALPLIFTADATEGSWVESITLKSVLSPALTVGRIFVCTATGAYTPGTTNTVVNTAMIREISLPVITTSNTVAQTDFEIPIRKFLPASMKLLIGFGTSTGAAGTGYAVTTWGGKL